MENINKVNPKIGDILEGRVKKILDFGIFVEIDAENSVDVFVHISKLTDGFVKNPHDIVSEDEIVKLEIIESKNAKNKLTGKLV